MRVRVDVDDYYDDRDEMEYSYWEVHSELDDELLGNGGGGSFTDCVKNAVTFCFENGYELDMEDIILSHWKGDIDKWEEEWEKAHDGTTGSQGSVCHHIGRPTMEVSEQNGEGRSRTWKAKALRDNEPR